MDIRFVISRSILYFILIITVALSFTFVTFSTAQFFEGQGQIWITLLVSLIIVIGLDPLKRLLSKLTDKFFFKGKIEYQDVLRDTGEILARELDLERLLEALKNHLEKQIKLKSVNILTYNEKSKRFENLIAAGSFNLLKENIIIDYLEKHKEFVVTEELARKRSDKKYKNDDEVLQTLEKKLDELNVSLAVPIFSEERLSGIFLIEGKLSGSPFSQADLNFFEVLAPQVATALEKSKLFEEVQEAKANLEILVDQRTADLKERNHYLNALQELINLITRSLDFKKVMQTIADGINKELGFIGGLLNFVSENGKSISVGAITKTPLTEKVIAMLPQDPRRYAVPLSDSSNLGVQAINNREIVYGDKFYDFLRPAVPEILVNAIQKVLGAKSFVSVPVYSEERVIGTILFVLKKTSGEITQVEREMMKSLADQVGIVYRNLTLYKRIQEANDELKVANVRLKKLDEAKSEFLSIASHQLRTPLTGIKGYLSMILEGDFGHVPSNIKGTLEDVFQNTDRLTRLVNIFLNVSRIESGRFEITKQDADLVKMVEATVKNLKLSADQKKLDLIFHRPKKSLPMIKLDQEKIMDVLLNLVDNAIKYTPKGKVEIFLENIGQAVKVTIKDTGIGIKKGEDRELFKKFVRGEGIAQINTGGSGLGLFIAKKIVEAHGGKVWAESEGKDMGSSFIFTLPVGEEEGI
ncbi:MAG TPA: GAF domain-containing sensor histidine kinase [Patescibacteria group bacterium]|nr:GAF domain-containing sensor histidine kinase [Patescibacteria group bacterium]